MHSEDIYQSVVNMWRGFQINTPTALERYLDSFRILFAYHSGKIENDEIDYHDTREVFENGRVTSFSGATRTLFEMQNQKTCYELLLPKIIKREPISISLIKEIHAALTAGTYDERRYIENNERPGEFKKHDYVTGINEVGSPPERAATDLENLLQEINGILEDKELTPSKLLKAAAYLHCRIEYIHPFADGNGRVGRTLVNYYLMTNNHPPLIVYEKDRKFYYEALQVYDEKEDIDPMFRFFVYAVESTWQKTLERQQTVKPEKDLDSGLEL